MKARSLTHNAVDIIQSEGQFAVAQACQTILQNPYDNGVVCEALHYYAENVLPKVFPIFPALICLTSKAAGGTPENARSVAAAMLLITSSGDIHDDIVDDSTHKFGKKTLFGRYGKNIALLAGDVLLMQGMSALLNDCVLSGEQRMSISDLVAASMFEIVKAEAVETTLWQKTNVTPTEFFEVIKLKGGVAELHCRIGGILGGGDQKTIEALTRYGRTIGVLLTLKEEFVDLTSSVELEHRIKHELPPYPMLCALQNKALKAKIAAITKKDEFSPKDLALVAELVLGSIEVGELKEEFRGFGRKELEENSFLSGKKKAEELVCLLEALTAELAVV